MMEPMPNPGAEQSRVTRTCGFLHFFYIADAKGLAIGSRFTSYQSLRCVVAERVCSVFTHTVLPFCVVRPCFDQDIVPTRIRTDVHLDSAIFR